MSKDKDEKQCMSICTINFPRHEEMELFETAYSDAVKQLAQ